MHDVPSFLQSSARRMQLLTQPLCALFFTDDVATARTLHCCVRGSNAWGGRNGAWAAITRPPTTRLSHCHPFPPVDSQNTPPHSSCCRCSPEKNGAVNGTVPPSSPVQLAPPSAARAATAPPRTIQASMVLFLRHDACNAPSHPPSVLPLVAEQSSSRHGYCCARVKHASISHTTTPATLSRNLSGRFPHQPLRQPVLPPPPPLSMPLEPQFGLPDQPCRSQWYCSSRICPRKRQRPARHV